MRRASPLIATSALAVLAVALPGVAAAAMPSAPAWASSGPSPAAWTTERAQAGTIYAVSAAVDDDGHLHIAASSTNGILYLTDTGGAWASRLVLANSAGAPGPAPDPAASHETWDVPSIALDDTGHVFIAAAYGCFACAPGDTLGIWTVTDRGRAAGTFGPPQKVAGTDATDPSLKVHDGHLYVAYGTVGRPGPEHTPIYLKTDATGSWTRTRIILDGYGPSLRVDSTGHARVAFAGPGDIRYARATTVSGGFVTTVIPGSSGRSDGDPSLALDSAEQPHVAWPGPSATLYSRATAGGWSAISRFGSWTVAVSLSVDAADVPHIATGRGKVTHTWRTGGSWKTETIATGADPYTGGVAIRATPTGLYVVYARTTDQRGVWVARS